MRAVLLLLLAGACGGARSEVEGADDADDEAEEDPSDPLRGAWWTGVGPDGDALPCPLELEFFADGTVEANFLSDDGPEQMCSFARLPAARIAGDPPVVRIGGQLAACLWKREGPRLRLTCEDHEEPPTSFEDSVLLERRRVRPREGLGALVGRWKSAAFWGPAATLAIDPSGRATLDASSGQIRIRGRGLLDIENGPAVTHCRYRALEDRLTMRCARVGEPAPTALASPVPFETRVYRREGAGTRGPAVADPHAAALRRQGGDADGDGVPNAGDACPEDAEDLDDFEDGDGCPDPDDDRDGIPDSHDACPQVPEDRDGDTDFDGCPEGGGHDRDGDGAPDADDRCPDDPEDRDGFEEADGCPDPDNDQDGIPDVDDLCPNEPEDRDGREDEDGCPDR